MLHLNTHTHTQIQSNRDLDLLFPRKARVTLERILLDQTRASRQVGKHGSTKVLFC